MSVPRHIAIVMDGNGRWATRRLLPRVAGHRQGAETLRTAVEACIERGVEFVTVFAFSSENWQRPADEVSGLMELLVNALNREVPRLATHGVRLKFIGERDGLSKRVLEGIELAEAKTADNRRLTLTVAFNYGGRWDLVQACRRLIAQGVAPDQVSERLLSDHLSLAYAPDPDLLIRTGGEQRLSNFLLWQAAYAELFFSERLWPEFSSDDLDKAIAAYSRRDRRFGKVKAPADAGAQAERRVASPTARAA